jgi:hypothetical protein
VAWPAVLLLGAAGGHIYRMNAYQMNVHKNYAAGNSGLLLWGDVVIPLAGFLFLALARPANRAYGASAKPRHR